MMADHLVTASAPFRSNQLPMSPINTKVYACGERCVTSCMKEAGEYPVYTKCTTKCMEPCIRTLVDGVYKCTFGCTKSLSTEFATDSSSSKHQEAAIQSLSAILHRHWRHLLRLHGRNLPHPANPRACGPAARCQLLQRAPVALCARRPLLPTHQDLRHLRRKRPPRTHFGVLAVPPPGDLECSLGAPRPWDLQDRGLHNFLVRQRCYDVIFALRRFQSSDPDR
ncbi:hypothetical protein M0R45_031619 [Rubus argutus]|uniref:Uncharacterized protein n=1 Tax=Rubus argutus TaxID=59490 RepID=A0AAW1WF60_RUBAR